MALLAPIFLAPLLFEDDNLLGLALLYDFANYPGPLYQGLTHLDGVGVGYQEDLLNEHLVSPVSGQAFHPEDVSRRDPVLFPACLNDGEQGNLQISI